MPGRTESLLYSYYFADVYYRNGCNILAVDVRAHGLSDGKYQTGGIKESDDCVLWIKLINEKYGINDFTIHGICIGGATAVYTYVKLKSAGSGLVKRIVTDGVYQSFYEMYKMNFRMYKKSSFPALQVCASKYKELRFFPEGRHSHVRSTQEAEYDEAIAQFLQKHA